MREPEHNCGDCPHLATGGASCARLSFANIVQLLPRGFSCLIDTFEDGATASGNEAAGRAGDAA